MNLVQLDLDNTLIDGQYNLTAPESELRAIADELTDKGFQIGFCSDSALITLRQWANRLGFTGPIVAERGAVVGDPIRSTEDVVDVSATGWFRQFREIFVTEMMRRFPDSTIIVGDATRFVKDHMVNTALTSKVFAVNGFRTASLSMFACCPNTDRTLLIPEVKLLTQASQIAEEVLNSIGKSKDDLFWDENPKYGVLIIHASSTEKWRGVSAIIDQFHPEKIVMVGDGVADFIGLDHVVHYAVGNAELRYKKQSHFVSQHPITEGVIECLRHISDNC